MNPDGTPKLIGTSTLWTVFNGFDPTLHDNLFGTGVMGVEVQLTGWALNRQDAFGDMLFFRFKISNKDGTDIEKAYVASWNDIDVGDAIDLVGVETTLSLRFNYKTRTDAVYGPNPPAVGIDLALAKQQAKDLVNAYPNPFFRNNIDLSRPFEQVITFTHLPEGDATIYIYTLSGELVRQLRHSNGTQFEEWDLRGTAGRARQGLPLAESQVEGNGAKPRGEELLVERYSRRKRIS